MSSFLYRLGRACFRHRWRTLLVWGLVIATLGGLAGVVRDDFDDNFTIPGASSQKALDQLNMNFPQVSGASASMVVVAPDGSRVGDPTVRGPIEASLKRLDDLAVVDSAVSPWDKHVKGMISGDQRAAIVTVRLDKDDAELTDADRDELQHAATALREDLPAGSEVAMGGEAFSRHVPGMSLVEVAGVGVALIVLLFTLGSLIAAGLPLLTAIVGVLVTMCVLLICTGVAKINSTTPMLAVMLGLAVGIDYALFILSRHREQLRDGLDPEESTARAVATAGSAVVFAGLTVIIALVGLGVAGIPFLTTMGVFAALGVAFAVLIALTLLPALMGLVGRRMVPRTRRRAAARADRPRGGIYRWWVNVATKVPLLTIAIVIFGAVALTLPARHLYLALPSSAESPAASPDRIAYDTIDRHFGPGFNGPLIVTAVIVGSDDPLGVMDGLKADIEKMPGVSRVPIATPNENAEVGFVQVVPETGPNDPATKALVQRLRDKEADWQREYDVPTAVTGATAIQIDVSDRLGQALLPFGVFVVGLSLVLLTMVFRSIAVPIKATLGYLLSIGVAFGTTTLVFNDGWARQLINLEKPGPIISFLPILLMGILFGLAMDYEVFLVSRMREDHVHGRDARAAVTSGFIGSAPVVVAAALIMFSVFAFFVPKGEGAMKPIAFALAVGVAFDAFVVRMTLVPAVMWLLGEKAWWLPRWLDRVLPSFDVEGEALHTQLALSNWPPREQHFLLFTEDLGVDQLFEHISLQLRAGQVLVVEGPPAQRAALLFALSGRLRPDHGRGRVAGGLLMEESAQVRRQTSFVDVSSTEDAVRDLRAAERSRRPVVFVDDADALHSQAESHDLEQLLRTVTDPRNGRAAVLGVANPDVIAPALPGGFFVIDLGSGSDTGFSAPVEPGHALLTAAEPR